MEPYETYKDSGIEWIGEIPVGWEVKKLKYVLTEHSGNGFPDKEQGNKNASIPFYKVSDINGKDIYINTSNNYVESEVAKKHNWNIVPKHSIITAKIGEALRKNHRKISLVDCIIDNNCIALEAKTIDYKFNYYLLSLIDFSWFVNPGAVPSLSVDKFKSFIAPIPNTDGQTAIANYLDRKTAEIDALIAQKERLLELYEEEKTAIINNAVTKGIDPNAELKDSRVEWMGEIPKDWKIIKLVRIVEKLTNGYVGPTREIMRDSGVPYIQGIHIKNNSIRFTPSGNYYVEKDWSIKHPKSILKTDDLLVVQTGSIGDVGIVQEEFDEANCHALLIVRVNQAHVLPKYLLYYLSSPVGFAHLQKIKTGEILFHINGSKLKGIDITLPPLNEQTAIVQHIEAESARIDAKITKTQRIIELQKEYRLALISEVVTGKIKVSPLADEAVLQ